MKPKSSRWFRPGKSLATAFMVVTLSVGKTQAADTVLDNLAINNGSTYTVGAGDTLTVGSGSGNYLHVASGGGTTGTLDVSLADAFTANVGNFYVGTGNSGGTGTANLGALNTITASTLFGVGTSFWDFTNGTLTTAASGTTTIHTPDFKIGWAIANGTSGGTGSMTIGSGASLIVDGVVSGNTSGRAAMWVGYDEEQYGRSSSGTLNLSAGTASLTLSSLVVGGQTGNGSTPGTLTMGAGGTNHLDVSGTGNVVRIGYLGLFGGSGTGSSTGTVTLANLDATSQVVSTDNSTAILLGQRMAGATGSTTGTLNLVGGTLKITTTGSAIGTDGSGGTSNLNIHGTTLKAGASSSTWIQGLTSANIKSGGVTFDTDGYNIGVAQALLEDSGSTGGGLTKTGAGTLTLSGANTFTGATTITGGKLVISSAGSIHASSTPTIGAGDLRYDNTTTPLAAAPQFSGTGGSFGGTGTVTPAITIPDGNYLAPGDGGGTLTLSGGLTLQTGAGVKIEIPGSSLAQINGDYTDSLGAHMLLVSGTPTLNQPYTFVQWTGDSGTLPDGVQSNWSLAPTIQGVTANWVGTELTDEWTTTASWVIVNSYTGVVEADLDTKTLTFTLTGETGTAATPEAVNDVAIDPITANIQITGSSSPVTVNSLRVGGAYNSSPVLTLGTGSMNVTTTLTVTGNGTLDATNAPLTAPTLNVSGSGAITLGHASGSITTANLSGGSITVGAGTLTTANVTGGVITVNGGSVPVVNLSGTGALAGTQAVPQVNVTGGTPGFSGNATVMTVTGGGVTTTGGTIGTLNHNTGSDTSTIGADTLVTAANFLAGTINFNSTQTNGTLTLPDGSTATVVSGSGAKAATVDVSKGAGTFDATNPLAITNLLLLPDSISATLTEGSAFTASGANLADPLSSGELALAGGKLTLYAPGGFILPTVGSGPSVWFDASDTSTMFTDTAGTTAVTSNSQTVARWNSRSSGHYLMQTDSGARPTYTENQAQGNPILDFGALQSGKYFSLYSGGSQVELNLGNSANTVFMIVKGSNFLLGNNGSYDFHRGDALNPTAPIWSGQYADNSIRSGSTYLNKTLVNGTNTGLTGGSTYDLVDVVTTGTGNARFNALALDRSYRTGGMQYGEILVFPGALNTTDRQAVENYLQGKWITGDGAAPGAVILPTMAIAASGGVDSTLSLGESGTPAGTHSLAALNLTAGTAESGSNTGLLLQDGLNLSVAGISASYPDGGTGLRSASIGNGTTAPVLSLTSGSQVNVDGNVTLTIGSVIANPASGTTAVSKTGSGSLVLTGINTYTGDTSVSGGALFLADNAGLAFVVTDAGSNKITGAGTADIEGDFTINTSAVTLETGSWPLVDASDKSFASSFTINGGWTETDNVWTLEDGGNTWKFSEATGTLYLNQEPPPGDDYSAWDDFYGADLSDKNADFDGDGMSNFQEYAFGLDPTSGASSNPVTDINLAAGQFTYTRRINSGLTYTIWTSETLDNWVLVENPAPDQDQVGVNGNTETIQVTLPEAPTSSKFFVRVKAETPAN